MTLRVLGHEKKIVVDVRAQDRLGRLYAGHSEPAFVDPLRVGPRVQDLVGVRGDSDQPILATRHAYHPRNRDPLPSEGEIEMARAEIWVERVGDQRFLRRFEDGAVRTLVLSTDQPIRYVGGTNLLEGQRIRVFATGARLFFVELNALRILNVERLPATPTAFAANPDVALTLVDQNVFAFDYEGNSVPVRLPPTDDLAPRAERNRYALIGAARAGNRVFEIDLQDGVVVPTEPSRAYPTNREIILTSTELARLGRMISIDSDQIWFQRGMISRHGKGPRTAYTEDIYGGSVELASIWLGLDTVFAIAEPDGSLQIYSAERRCYHL
ncbi:MAG: hypothetical protein AAGF12_04910 [Myxococcota bacterium]